MLIKGGHEEGDALADALIETDNMTSWQGQRIDTTSTHGTGCTLASAIAYFLAEGSTLADAVARAREFVRVALQEAPGLGQGAGPIGQQSVRLDVGAALRLNQVTVTGTDYERSVEFYRRLGLKQIVDNPPDYARFETAGGVTFSVQIDPEEKIVATTAIYLECDDLDERVEQLARSGIPFEHGPRNQPWMWREARLRDPDGNIIFLYKAGEARRFPPWRMDALNADFLLIVGRSVWTRFRRGTQGDSMPRRCNFKLELDYPQPLAGVDEAGCAPLAGPVVAGACILNRERFPRGIDEFKNLPIHKREAIYKQLVKCAAWGVGVATVEEIDQIKIYWARMLAMSRAVEALGLEPAWVLVDGNATPRGSGRRRRSSTATPNAARSPQPRSSPRSRATG